MLLIKSSRASDGDTLDDERRERALSKTKKSSGVKRNTDEVYPRLLLDLPVDPVDAWEREMVARVNRREQLYFAEPVYTRNSQDRANKSE